MEWESSQLQPVLFPYLVSAIGHGKPDESLKTSLGQLIKKLDQQLHGKQFVVEGEITGADIVIWSSLYPALCPKGAFAGWESEFKSVKQWFDRLLQLPAFSTAVETVTKGKGVSAFKTSLLSQPVPLSLKSANSGLSAGVKAMSVVSTSHTGESQSIFGTKEATEAEVEAAIKTWEQGKKTCPKPLKIQHPILPQEGKRNILITSALPYVNNVPHLGNIIGCVLSADVFSRYCKLRNYNSLYICGTDEYGTATETKAMEEGITPQEICDKYNKLHKEIYEWFNIGFDYFGRTSTNQQTEIAQDIFWKLYNRQLIIKDSIEQLFCNICERFLADRFVEGTCPLCGYEDARGDQCDKCGKLINAVELKTPRCKMCSASPSVKSTQHLFLDLPKIEPELSRHLNRVFTSGTWTSNSKTITNSWIRDGLKPRCISRDLKWGTPVPLEGYTDKVFYVWFDAPIGYISITANYTDQWKKWWKNPNKVEMYNFLGKDNVPFHSVIFPCTLLGADDNYTVVSHMVATEYLNYEDGKFSKSRGVGVFGNHAKETGIPADVFRFYLLYVRPESQDSSFSWDDFQLKNNSELLNNLGNFINRGLMFLSNNFGGTVQEMVLTEEDQQLLALVNSELSTYVENMEQARLRDSIRNILSISRYGNQHMQYNKPWILVKGSSEEKSRAGTVVSLASNISALLSVLLRPYMPSVSVTIQEQLQLPDEAVIICDQFVCQLPPGHKIGKPSPLFQKIETATITELKKRFAGKPEVKNQQAAPTPVPSQAVNGPVNPAEVERLTEEVIKQGNIVRELKAQKKDKAEIDTAVSGLLQLKKQLALAQGQDPLELAAGAGKKRSKGKKK
ncbi:methionine--tRNA ligase, cytoplasmic-like isoform X2 [Liolophura sinensis]